MNNFAAYSFSEAGRKGINQDAILHKRLDDNSFVIAIADGIGGQKGGDIASKCAIDTVLKELSEGNSCLNSVFMKAQKNLEKIAIQNEDLSKLGTTLTVALISKNCVNVGHVGDTRMLHLRNKGILTITKDQTELQKLLDEGIISQERAKNYHRKNVLLSALAPNRDFEFQSLKFKLEEKDRILLLTDGAYSLITKKELRDISLEYNELDCFVKSAKRVIESRDIKDDYSLIAFEYI